MSEEGRNPPSRQCRHVRTIHTAPDAVFVAISADFVDDILMGRAETIIEEIECDLKRAIPQLTSIYIRPEKRQDAVTIDALDSRFAGSRRL